MSRKMYDKFDLDKIEGNLRDKVNCPVISLEDIVYDCRL